MGAALSQLQPYTSARHFFGAELRHRRVAAGLSQGQLARQVITHETMVNKVELALRVASVDLATRCDVVLAADGALIRLHQLVLAECARRADPVDLPVVLSGLEARALRRLLAVDRAEIRIEPNAQMPDLLDRIDYVLEVAEIAGQTAQPARKRP
jgi:transcriptional regulator with XRE-family HTH domain